MTRSGKGGPPTPLDEEQSRALAEGRHEELAAAVLESGDFGLAGWVWEQIWAFESAHGAYRSGNRHLDALRVALEIRNPSFLQSSLVTLQV